MPALPVNRIVPKTARLDAQAVPADCRPWLFLFFFRHQFLFRLGQCFDHHATDGFRVRPVAKIARDAAENILVPGLFKIGLDDLIGIGVRLIPGFSQQTRRPQSQQFVGTRLRLELHFLVMGIFGFKSA